MLPQKYQKRSFLKFDCELNIEELEREFLSIPDSEWASSYWGNIHCSIGMLLLRGGDQGTEYDFFSDTVSDKSVLKSLPYISQLIGDDGPFGKPDYAFIFKLKPDGVTLKHQDTIEKWFDMYRIHVPIITNPGAHLIVNEMSQHLDKGFAWTFDNQSDHGVVNGAEERVHLIFDVPYSEKMAAQIDHAEHLVGERVSAHVERINETSKAIPSYPGDEVMKGAIVNLRGQGANTAQIVMFLNDKKVPSKSFPVTPWDETMVDELS